MNINPKPSLNNSTKHITIAGNQFLYKHTCAGRNRVELPVFVDMLPRGVASRKYDRDLLN